MNLTLDQKATLDALVNFFGGKSMLVRSWEKDPHYRTLVKRGLTRWGKVRYGMREHVATEKGINIAKRFKKNWSQIWADRQPQEESE